RSRWPSGRLILVAQPQDRGRLAIAGQLGGDVAESSAVAEDGCAEAGPAAPDVGDDPPGDGGPGLLVGCFWHAVHDGGGRAEPPGGGRPGAAWMKTADETGFPPMLLDATLRAPP